MNELISIIVPVYNVEKYLDQCIESLVKQDYSNVEILLINDGSTDKSGEICENWKVKDNRIITIHLKNSGVSIARNIGIENSKGKYIYFIDSDDWLEYDTLSLLLKNLSIYNADLSSCGIKKDYNNKKIVLNKDKKTIIVSQKRMFHEILCNESIYGYVYNKLFKAELVKGIIFDKDLYIQEDMDFTMEYLKKCKKCVYTEAEYYHYRQRIESVTGEIGYSYKKLSIVKVYEKAISLYEKYCPESLYIVQRNYLKININIIGRIKIAKYKNKKIQDQLKSNIDKYYWKVLKEKKNSLGMKINIFLSYYFPGVMLKLKQKIIKIKEEKLG